MTSLLHLEQLLWAITIALSAALFLLLVVRRADRSHPAFTLYLGLVLVQAAILVAAYTAWGFRSHNAWLTGWISQAVVICARAAAVLEVCRMMLGHYRGVWSLAWRILSLAALGVLLYSAVASGLRWELAVPNLDRGIEMAIAVVIVGLLVFARLYGVKSDPGTKGLAAGFCLYSCFHVLNNTVLERFMYQYFDWWNVLGIVAFAGTVTIWGWAVLQMRAAQEDALALLPGDVYRVLIPEVNLKLSELNEQLSRFWKAEAPRP